MRDRSKVINVEISEQAKKIYDQQPHKGEFVSEAIIEKSGNAITLTDADKGWVRQEIEKIVKEMKER
jgi:ketol-acid reductoisomerase